MQEEGQALYLLLLAHQLEEAPRPVLHPSLLVLAVPRLERLAHPSPVARPMLGGLQHHPHPTTPRPAHSSVALLHGAELPELQLDP